MSNLGSKPKFLALVLAFTCIAGLHAPCRAESPKMLKTSPSSITGSIEIPAVEGDGDGDELLEHWGDPQYSREERLQLGGLTAFLVAAGIAAYRRRLLIRRAYRND